MTGTALRALLNSTARSSAGTRRIAVRRYVQADASVTVDVDDAGVLREADRLLRAYVPRTSPGRSRCRVVARTVGPLRSAAGFAFAGAPSIALGPGITGRVLDDADRATASFWFAPDTLAYVDLHHGAVDLWCSGAGALRSWVPRLVREAMAVQMLASGSVHAHASACTIRGTGVLIAGPPGAGATTALVTCLRLLGADLVADAGVLLRPDARSVTGHPVPTPLHLPAGVLRAFPELTRLPGTPDSRPDRVAAAFRVDPDDLPVLLRGGTVGAMVRPRVMLWPHLELDRASTPRARRVPVDEVRDVLLRTRMFTTAPDGHRHRGVAVVGWMFDRLTGPRPVTAATRDVADVLAGSVECYRVAVTSDPRALAAQVDGLIAGGR